MSGKGKSRQGTNKGNGEKPDEANASTPTVMAADVRTLKPGGASLAGGGNTQLLAELLQSLTHLRAGVGTGNTSVQMTAIECADYTAHCAAQGQKDEAEKERKQAEAITVAVNAALIKYQGLPTITNVDAQRKKAKLKKYKLTAAQETDSDAAGDHDVSSLDSDPAPSSPAAKAKAKRVRQTMAKREAAEQKDSQLK
jgi:hypothetical protein